MKRDDLTGLKISDITPGGTALEIGIEKGDTLLSINGKEAPDSLAYMYLISNEDVTLLVMKKDGGLVEIELEKDFEDDLGLIFLPMSVHRCNNKCVFCFVSQMPKGMRRSLYVKDEDYRHSFMYGNYITLTTLKDEDYARIIRDRLSPLYVSVHATDEDVRRFLLGNKKAPPILDGIKRLTEGGIQLHTQAVVCPGINDGDVLYRTVEDLHAFFPMVESLAVVPVGLTRHREKMYPIKAFTKAQAGRLLDGLDSYRKRYRRAHKTGFVYPSDELYIKAGRDFPRDRDYDGYPQIDNGVGLVRDFMTEFGKLEKRLTASFNKKKVLLVTGVSFAPYLRQMASSVNEKAGINVSVLAVKNALLGESVTVAGLLSGKDITAALKGKKADAAIIPSVALRDGGNVFLDDMTPDDVERESGVRIVMADPTAQGLIDAIKALEVS